MARKQKSTKAKVRWITADDEIFAAENRQFLAFAFLRGYADYPDGSFKFLRRGSPEESRAKEELLRTLRDDVLPYSESVSAARLSQRQINRVVEVGLLLQELARLLDERENPFGGQRRLVLQERGNKRQPHNRRDRHIAEFIARQLHADRKMESTVAKAMELCGGSRDYIFRVWKKRGGSAKKDLGEVTRLAGSR